MNPVAKALVFVDRGNYVRMKIARKGGRKLDSLHPGCGRSPQQARKRGGALESFEAVLCRRAVTVHILSDQVNLAIAVIAQLFDLGDDLGSHTAFLSAA